MSNGKMVTYRLKDDWVPFGKGAEFIDDDDGTYTLKGNANVTARIPAGLLEVIGKDRWKPREHRDYYYIECNGDISTTSFYPGAESDKNRLAIGNCFRIEEDALEMVKWLKARQRLIDGGAEFMNGVGVDSEDIAYYGVAFDKTRGILHTIKCYNIGDDVFEKKLYFLTEDDAEKSIRDYRDDWLTYLDVKEEIGDDEKNSI